jgi:hypothetical protein
MRYYVEATYTVTESLAFDLPEGKTWEDVTHYFVKFGMLTIFFADGSVAMRDIPIPENGPDALRSHSTSVYEANADGSPGFHRRVAHSEGG